MRVVWRDMKCQDPRLARLRLMLAAFVVGLFAMGCGSTVEGEPERASGQEGLFNPCTDIPDSVIEGVGLDPATESADIFGVEQPGWKICKWSGEWYFFTIFSTEHPIERLRANEEYVDIESIPIGTRMGVEFHKADDPSLTRCFVALAVDQGMVWLSVNTKATFVQTEPTCSLTRRYADALESNLPR
ncbi:DUF3558 domain-containing protein [Rhodococcus sp. AD45-ID]|nr:hypothetical protein SZ00_05964 [Rhodococcus sp. AD45]PSR39328.1 DUF3558 domain-containing protein [Rhodococcus sp. AD45-ID]